MSLRRPLVDALIRLALDEDLARGDVTSEAIFSAEDTVSVAFRPRQEIVVSGLWVLRRVVEIGDPTLSFECIVEDGQTVAAGGIIARISGPARSLLMLERTCLNFLSHLSAIATFTAQCVEALGPGRARLVDTRKTTPGWRQLEKAAVRHGGGRNHRHDLGDGVMIKDNHIAAAGSIERAVSAVRASSHHLLRIELEVDTEAQLETAIGLGVDVVMLDNFDNQRVAAAVQKIRAERPEMVVELSGGITMERLPTLQALGADVVSMGALTHSAPSVDIGLDYV